MAWTPPDDVRAQVLRLWDRGRILAARLGGEPLFPFSARLSRPQTRELSERFGEAQAWIRALEAGSKSALGTGYDVVYADINHRQLGSNRVPEAVVVPSEQDALALIGRRRESEAFDRLVRMTRDSHPELVPWIARKPLELLDRGEDWACILAVVAWFRKHPKSGIYARQIDVPGVHTKLIERNRRLLGELLDLAVCATDIDQDAVGAQAFERRYGLRSKPALVRFRLLDPRLRIGGLDDISTPVAQLAGIDLPVRRVFVTENEINGLAFPSVDEGMVIFGLGYGVELLGEIPWLNSKTVFYWGDLDTHGFAILDRLRGALPHTRSFLMDRETLLTHRALWGREPERQDKPLARLNAEEAAVYDDLRFDRLGERVRLEQERIRFGLVTQAVASCCAGAIGAGAGRPGDVQTLK
jgi:hypothetical protein